MIERRAHRAGGHAQTKTNQAVKSDQFVSVNTFKGFPTTPGNIVSEKNIPPCFLQMTFKYIP